MELEPQAQPDFWEHWADKLIQAGLAEDYVRDELARYQVTETNWPEGQADFRHLMGEIFQDVIDSSPLRTK